MPDMDGIMLAQAIKADPAIREIPLVALSSVDSHAHRGTTESLGFVAWLQKPARQSTLRDCSRRYHQGAALPPRSEAPVPLPPHAHGTRMLLVEDNPVNREVAMGLLELLGYQVDSAEDGQQACELSATRAYDIILMDCQMPVMDGFTATATIRERERQMQAVRIPIIALTANAMEGDRERCLAAGMDDYLAKPFSHQALADTLARWCPPRDQSQPTAFAALPTTATAVVEKGTQSPARPVPTMCAEVLTRNADSECALDGQALAQLYQLRRPERPDPVAKILTSFLDSSTRQVSAIQDAVMQQDGQALFQAAHALKSSSAMIGALALSDFVKDLEQMGRQGTVLHNRVKMAEFDALYKAVRQAVQDELGKEAA